MATGKKKVFMNKTNQAGQSFPTTNPNFVPPEPKSSDVTFNKGTLGNKTVTTAGKNLTQEEYKTSLPSGSGNITPNVQAVQKQEQDIQKAISDKVIADRALQAQHDLNIKNRALQVTTPTGTTSTTPTATTTQTPIQMQEERFNVDFQKAQEATRGQTLGQGAVDLLKGKAIKDTSIGGLFETMALGGAKGVAGLVDFVRSLKDEGKSLKQLQAEKIFSKAESDINTDIALFQAGDPSVPEEQIFRKLQILRDANNQLLATTKQKFTYRNLISDGVDVNVYGVLNEDVIDTLNNKFETAKLRRQL